MRRSTKFLIGYFLFFIGLSAIAMAPGGALVVLLITGMALPLFGMPGLVVIAAPTVVIYSAALLPFWFSFRVPTHPIGAGGSGAARSGGHRHRSGPRLARGDAAVRGANGQGRHEPPGNAQAQEHRTEWRRHVGLVRLRGNGRRSECLLQRDLPAAVVQRRSGPGADDTNAGHLHEPAGGIDPERHLSHRASGNPVRRPIPTAPTSRKLFATA